MILPMQVRADLVRLASTNGVAQSTTSLKDGSTLTSVTLNRSQPLLLWPAAATVSIPGA
jgi:hypothetical protein